MDPGGVASRFLTGGIAFTGVVVVIIVFLGALAYLTDVMGVNTRRLVGGIMVLVFLVGVGVAVAIMFPGLPMEIYEYINRLGYR